MVSAMVVVHAAMLVVAVVTVAALAELTAVVVLANAETPVSVALVTTTPLAHSPSFASPVGELSFFSSLMVMAMFMVATPLSELCVVTVLLAVMLLTVPIADVVVVAVEQGGVLVPDDDEFGGELERLEFDDVLLLLVVAVAADDVADVEFAARSRPPVFCCCSRCNLCERGVEGEQRKRERER